MLCSPRTQLVPVVQTVSILEDWFDSHHPEETLASLVSIVNGNV